MTTAATARETEPKDDFTVACKPGYGLSRWCTVHEGYYALLTPKCARKRAAEKGALAEYDRLIGMGFGL